jgi:hypothetical protein
MWRRNVKKVMSSAILRRTKAMLAQVCGAVTILALVVAPACAPLCAVKVCSQALSSAEKDSPCHLMKIPSGSANHVHGAQICGARELPAAALNSTNKNGLLQNDRFEAFGVGRHNLSQKVSSFSGQSQDRCFACTSSPHRSSSLSLMSVLRI